MLKVSRMGRVTERLKDTEKPITEEASKSQKVMTDTEFFFFFQILEDSSTNEKCKNIFTILRQSYV